MTEESRYSSSLLASAGSHKPTLSVLIRNADIPDATPSSRASHENDDDGPTERDDDLPLVKPLSHDLFEGDEWDVNDFLLSRRHVPLDDFKSELRRFLAELRASLVKVINEEYETFISLSLGLKQANVAASLNAIKRPVMGLRSEVNRVRDELDQQRVELEELLESKAEIRRETAELKRLVEVDSLTNKIEALLLVSSDTATAQATTAEDSDAKRLERIASDYKQLQYLFSKALACPFLDTIQPRIEKVASQLRAELRKALHQAIKSDSRKRNDEIGSLFRTFASLNAFEDAEATVRSSVVAPFVLQTISPDALSATNDDTKDLEFIRPPQAYDQAPKGSVAAALTRLYNHIIVFIARDIAPLLDLADRAQAVVYRGRSALAMTASKDSLTNGHADDEHCFQIIGRVVFPEIASRLSTEIGNVLFSAGRPAVFYENYTLTRQLIERMEEFCSDKDALRRLRVTDAYTSFTKRFQLPVYFQLRFKEIVTGVERAFETTSASSATETFLMPETEAVWHALKSCWRPGVFLDELFARFWRLTLQLLVRYRTWAHRAAPKASAAIASSSSSSNLAALAGQSSRASADMRASSSRLQPGTGGPPSRPSTPSSLNEEQQEEQTLRQCSVIVSDVMSFRTHVLRLWDDRIRPALHASSSSGGGSSEGELSATNERASPHAVLMASLDNLTSLVPSLSDQVVTILVKRATKPLKSAGTVASQVRATSSRSASSSSGPSVEVSYFVPAILKDVKAYESGIGRFVDAQTRGEWKKRVLEDVLSRYATILQSQKKAQDSLSWLKRGRQGLSFFSRSSTPSGSADEQNPSTSTEEERFAAQMEVDVNALAEDVRSVGVAVESLDGWRVLKNAISGGAEASGGSTQQES